MTMKKSQSTSITFLLLSTLCLALVSAQSACRPKISVSSGSQDVSFQPGDCLIESSSGYHLVFESNCNLVLYNEETPLWTSASFQDDDTSNCKAVFQQDGNLVVYLYAETPEFSLLEDSLPEASSRTALWASDTFTQIQIASLEINNKHHLQIVQTYNSNYHVILDVSNPPPHQTPRPFRLSDKPNVIVNSTDAKDFVFQEQQYIGDLDNTNLIFQDDCNFVLYDESGPQWSSGSQRNVQYSCELTVTRKGTLVMSAKDDPSVVYWTWDGTSAVQGEIIWTEITVDNGVMEITYVVGNGFTVTYSTEGGSLALKQPQ